MQHRDQAAGSQPGQAVSSFSASLSPVDELLDSLRPRAERTPSGAAGEPLISADAMDFGGRRRGAAPASAITSQSRPLIDWKRDSRDGDGGDLQSRRSRASDRASSASPKSGDRRTGRARRRRSLIWANSGWRTWGGGATVVQVTQCGDSNDLRLRPCVSKLKRTGTRESSAMYSGADQGVDSASRSAKALEHAAVGRCSGAAGGHRQACARQLELPPGGACCCSALSAGLTSLRRRASSCCDSIALDSQPRAMHKNTEL